MCDGNASESLKQNWNWKGRTKRAKTPVPVLPPCFTFGSRVLPVISTPRPNLFTKSLTCYLNFSQG